jgi:uncharacterized membrane protein YidH (DUF202 family)
VTTSSDLRKTRLAKRDEFRKARLELVVSSAESALKSAFLVNGGGCVALLAFLGQASRQSVPVSHWLSSALLALVVGTALASIATGLSFLAQYGYMMGKRRSLFGRSAKSLTAANIVLVMLSHVCFVLAGFLACKGFP